MATSSRPLQLAIHNIALNRRHPAVSVGELALILELDIALGHRRDFLRRVRRALKDAASQGLKMGKIRLSLILLRN